jgi:hypothetical protein
VIVTVPTASSLQERPRSGKPDSHFFLLHAFFMIRFVWEIHPEMRLSLNETSAPSVVAAAWNDEFATLCSP